MALLDIAATRNRRGEKVFTAELSPPRLYGEIDRIVSIARRLRALGLDAIAVTNSTGGSYKFSPWAIVEDIQRAMGHVPLLIHLTARDEGSVRSVYYHLHEMSLKGVRDVLVIRGDPSPGDSKLLDAYRFTTTRLVGLADGYRRGRLIDGSESEPLPTLDIFVAGHPEYPDSALDKHFRYLRAKIDAGANGIVSNIVTDPDRYFRYRDRARAAGIEAPILPSLLALTSLRRCEFLRDELHIPVPEANLGMLAGARPGDEPRLALADLVGKLERLVRGGAPGANFNVIVARDADFVVEAVAAVRRESWRASS
jgi:methylenetetrahydrofolate reductase (NADPH)